MEESRLSLLGRYTRNLIPKVQAPALLPWPADNALPVAEQIDCESVILLQPTGTPAIRCGPSSHLIRQTACYLPSLLSAKSEFSATVIYDNSPERARSILRPLRAGQRLVNWRWSRAFPCQQRVLTRDENALWIGPPRHATTREMVKAHLNNHPLQCQKSKPAYVKASQNPGNCATSRVVGECILALKRVIVS